MKSINKTIFIFLFLLYTSSCEKEKKDNPYTTKAFENGILVLNEGLFQQGNSSLSWVNLKDLSVNNSIFQEKTGRNLGDTGNDLKQYGNKIYVLVNVSSTLEILDASNGKPLKQISFLNGNQSKQPRCITFYKSKAYISCFDGFVDVLDTASLEIETRVQVGLNPDHIIAFNDKVLVANSGGLNSPNLDSSISIINSTNLYETKLIVGKNPGQMKVIDDKLFIIIRGNYGSIPPILKKIDLNTMEIIANYTFRPSIIEKFNSNLLIVYEENNSQKLGLFNANTGNWIDPEFISLSDIQTLYKVHFEPKNNKIYLFDAKGYTNLGKLITHDINGNKVQSFTVGLNPNSMIFFD
jgi:DNA-binding beta-propeller fold protein YncE